MSESLFKKGQVVYMYTSITHTLVTGTILSLQQRRFGWKYLLEYTVNDLDFGYTYRKTVWRCEKRIFI